MSFRYVAMLAGGMVTLGGCQAQEESPPSGGSAYEAVEERFVEHDCAAERCAEVAVSALRFPDSPALTEQLRRRLLVMGMGITDGENDRPADSWEGYAQAFLAQAEADRHLVPLHSASQARLEANVYARHDDLLIIELDSYVYHAGQAHGMPLTGFMVIDERLGRVVGFDDMLVDGQEEAFREALARAHRRWLQQTNADDDFAATWPLSESRNVAPLETAWVVRYNVYEIAPYAAGQPELHIPNDDLAGIVEPRYLVPQRE
ncbi:RsiV family protein [Halomonas heilongjiangensis]|uniref:DUF3298 domain-containing protein n=1 Tax=Halomonas heilongjiangensis TaxID=1387883 RepID=A0A2N7TVF3_9GAMM|nr:RsiV family protein [Halomonas heilongjiangensis]PMR72166.1 DUF3298 domain-containing protein [Halomonas heilongjiangensis]PXX91417.1 DUF3298 domain-containing protein [Halomonas heilongjiangensis]